jgi:transposase
MYRQRPLAALAAAHGIYLDADSPALPRGVIFKPVPLRWKVEQFFAWFSQWRRAAKNGCYSLEGFVRDVDGSMLGLSLRRVGCL